MFGCGVGVVGAGTTTGVVASNQVDTLAEAFSLYLEWVNSANVKVEYDLVIDGGIPLHFELQARRSMVIH